MILSARVLAGWITIEETPEEAEETEDADAGADDASTKV
jgi:hypothetical protein